MKIVTDKKVYVQLNDVMNLIHNCDGIAIPGAIFDQVFADRQPLICTDDNRYNFIEFTQPVVIEFFKNWTYSVDYLTLKDFSDQELEKQFYAIQETRNTIADKFNALPTEEKEANYNLYQECDLLEFKLLSIRDVVWFRQGHLKFKLPKGIAKDSGLKQQEAKEPKGFQKIINLFKPKKD